MSGMISFAISVQGDLDFLTNAAEDRELRRAVRDGAEYVRGVWASAVDGTFLPGMTKHVNDDDYRRSLGLPTAITRTGDYEYTVTADYDAVARIELGYGAYDMKPGLLHGAAAKIGKDGGRYTRVPFRFGTPIDRGPHKGESRPHFPGAMTMPAEVYRRVQDGTPYPDTGEGRRTKLPTLFDQESLGGVNREAILRDVPAPMSEPYTWQNGLYDGLRRTGAPGHHQYQTFRTVSEPRLASKQRLAADGRILKETVQKGSDPNSWIHPGQAPNPVVAAVTDYTRPTVEVYLGRALAGVVANRQGKP